MSRTAGSARKPQEITSSGRCSLLRNSLGSNSFLKPRVRLISLTTGSRWNCFPTPRHCVSVPALLSATAHTQLVLDVFTVSSWLSCKAELRCDVGPLPPCPALAKYYWPRSIPFSSTKSIMLRSSMAFASIYVMVEVTLFRYFSAEPSKDQPLSVFSFSSSIDFA